MKFALDQREAAELFGGGVNAFSRYENGKTKPSLALVKLLKVLDCHGFKNAKTFIRMECDAGMRIDPARPMSCHA